MTLKKAEDKNRLSITLVLLMSLFLPLLSLYATEFVKDGLVAFYTFDEGTVKGDSLKDVFGKSDAKIIGSLKPVAGKIGQAMECNGKKNYIEIPKLGAWKQASVECWVMEKRFNAIQGIVSTWQWAAGKVHFKFEGGEIQVHKNDGVKIRMKCKEKRWYHVVYTSNSASGDDPKSLKLYVDGKLIQEGKAGKTPENMDERRIGAEHNGRYLDGMIDEVRIYDRVLTTDEVINNSKVISNATTSVDARSKLATTWGKMKNR